MPPTRLLVKRPTYRLSALLLGFAAASAWGASSSPNEPAPGGSSGSAGQDASSVGLGGGGDSAGASGQGAAGGGGAAAGSSGAAGAMTDGGGGQSHGGSGTGGAAGAAGLGGAGTDNCAPVDVAGWSTDPDNPQMLSGLVSPIGGPDPDQASLQFFESSTVKITPGTYDLSSGADANFATCAHCLLVFEDVSGSGAATTFFQQSGTLTLASITSPPNGVVAGALTNAKLVEVTVDPNTYESTPVPGGACLFIANSSIATTASEAGKPCTNPSDCGSPTATVCDPKTATCPAQPGCTATAPNCADPSDVCLGQVELAAVGACYAKCDPLADTLCDAGFSCVPISLAASDGACFRSGTGAADGACNSAQSAISTGCVAGYVCTHDQGAEAAAGQCRKVCDFWGPYPGCGNEQDCTILGSVCTPIGETIGIGAACSAAWANCAPQGDAWKGVCIARDDAGLVCTQWCRLFGSDCPLGSGCNSELKLGNIGICVSGYTQPPAPPESWSCELDWYGDDYCDCNCGAWDVDCDDPAHPSSCTPPQVCLSAGNCGQPG